MTEKKWRPKRGDLINYWRNWLKDHSPICYPQDIGNMMQDPHRAIEAFWNRNKEHFQKCGAPKKRAVSELSKIVEKMRIYPYKNREELLLSDVHFELAKTLAKLTSREIILPLEKVEKLEEGPYTITSLTDEEADEEEKMIKKIEPDLEELRRNKTIREIAEETGMSKSAVHRKLKNLKK